MNFRSLKRTLSTWTSLTDLNRSDVIKLFMIAIFSVIAFSFNLSAQILLEDDRVVIGNEVNINSVDLDFSPAYYLDGIVYVTTHSEDFKVRMKDQRIKTNVMKLWQANRSFNGVLFEPQPFYRELKSSLHEGPLTFDSSYTKIYFTRNNESPNAKRRRKTLRRLSIYTAELVGDTWEGERKVEFNDDKANNAHPTLSPDGNLLVFASDREGGMGGMDLWAVAKTSGDWGEPYNLGPSINTGGNDVFPFLHEDGTLYYSSTTEDPDNEEGHLDIYYSRQNGSKWTKGKSLGPPFNSDSDDFGLIVNPENKKGYFSSDRPGGLGGDDIYSFQIISDRVGGPLDLTVEVSDAKSGAPVANAKITYLNTADVSLATALSDGLISGSESIGLTLTGGKLAESDANGSRKLRVNAGDYLLLVERDGYAPLQLPLSLYQGDMTLPVALEPKIGCTNLNIVVLDESTLLPVPTARVRFAGQVNGTNADMGTTEEGTALFCAPCGEIFGITASLGSQKSKPASFDTRGDACYNGQENTMTLYLGSASSTPTSNPLVVGSVLQLPSVYYPYGKWDLSVSARNDLNHLAAMMDMYPEMQIELGSHTDARGERAFNQQLSQRRADEAKNYLVNTTGVNPARIVAVGYGEQHPRNRCVNGVPCSDTEHARNRRTEITVLKVDRPVTISEELQSKAKQGIQYSSPPPISRSSSRNLTSTDTPSGAGADSRYWVVAGTFQEGGNASRRQQELEELGYSGVSIVSFSGTTGKAVVVGKFSQLAEAAQFSRALKEAHSIGAYVRKVK